MLDFRSPEKEANGGEARDVQGVAAAPERVYDDGARDRRRYRRGQDESGHAPLLRSRGTIDCATLGEKDGTARYGDIRDTRSMMTQEGAIAIKDLQQTNSI